MNSECINHIAAFIEKLPFGVLVFNDAKDIVANNTKVLEYVNVSIEDLLVRKIDEVIPEISFDAIVNPILSGNETDHNLEFQRDERTLLCTFALCNQIQGSEKVIIGTIEDITQFKNIEKVKKDFLSTILHKLRNPITTLKTSLSILRSDQLHAIADPYQEVVHMCHHEVNRLHLLINDLKNLFYIQTGLAEKELQFETIPLYECLASAIDDIEKSGIFTQVKECITIKGDRQCRVVADFENLKLSFYHVLKNALLFSPPGAPIEIMITPAHDMCMLAFTDKGIGIDENDVPRIFDTFFRADNAVTRKNDGNGLGLFIVKSLLSLMNGSIYYEKNKQTGSCFTILLPIITG